MSSNEPPEGPELTFIRSIVSNTGARLAHLDDEIARLRDRLQELEEERDPLAIYYAQNKAILSPLRRMPPEVLGQIFLWTLPHWRAVALSFPSLWSLFVINFSWQKMYPLSMLETQISRAQGLRIHFYGDQKKDCRPQIEMFRLFAEHSSRWEELRSDPKSHIGVESIDCFETAPSLLDAGFSNRYRHVPILLPAHQLTRYHLSGPWGMHQGMLKLLGPNFVEARIIVNYQSEPWPDPGETIHLSSLRRLFVSRPAVLEYIKAPNLEEITTLSMKNDGRDALTFLESFLVRSGCGLRRLCLIGDPDPRKTLAILHANPSIVELAISTHSNVGEGSRILMSNLTIPTVAPQLSGIFFASEKEGHIDYTAYLQFLQSRSKAVGCVLKTTGLVVRSGPSPDPATLRGLDVLRQDGLELVLVKGEEAAIVLDDWKLFPQWISPQSSMNLQIELTSSGNRTDWCDGATKILSSCHLVALPAIRFNFNSSSSMASDSGVLASSASRKELCGLDITVAATTLARHQELLTSNVPPAELEEERGSLERYRTQNKALLSPLRKMPPEVLGEIFLWTLPSVDVVFFRRRFDAKDSPWVLTDVSSHWRAVAVSTPALWSLIVINCLQMSANPLSAVKTQVQRAQTLKIHFYGVQGIDSQPQIEMFQFLVEHSARWAELFVELTSDLFPLLAGLRHRLSSLRRFLIQWNGPDSSVTAQSIDCFQTASCLVEAGIYNEYRHVPILLPGHQLTRYYLDGPWEMHAGLLKQVPNLVEARIAIDFDDGPWPDPLQAIDLMCLERLYVSNTEILDYLRAPALTEIALYINKNDDHNPDYLGPLVARCGCTLRRLSFKLGSPSAHVVTHILPKHPFITELAIIIGGRCLRDPANALISHLTIPNPTASAAISLHLSISYLACTNENSFDYTLYLNMLQSRRKADDCALESAALLIDSGPGPDAVTLSGLDTLRQDGLDFLFLEGKNASDIMKDFVYLPRWN
ncbi:hypothetical protein C8R44DRAFT_740857 [Mycena epipterygia]|nr:hypothetical protein C8R44DRAFT_740857 [Mycena epipterygia]